MARGMRCGRCWNHLVRGWYGAEDGHAVRGAKTGMGGIRGDVVRGSEMPVRKANDADDGRTQWRQRRLKEGEAKVLKLYQWLVGVRWWRWSNPARLSRG
jgi:hypothetical protein